MNVISLAPSQQTKKAFILWRGCVSMNFPTENVRFLVRSMRTWNFSM